MNHIRALFFGAASLALLLAFSCASAPEKAPAPEPAPVQVAPEPVPAPVPEPVAVAPAPEPAPVPVEPVKVRKEREVAFKTPILLKATTFYPDGLVDETVVYKYDATLIRLVEKSTFDPARIDPIERAVVETSAAGLVTAETTLDAEGRQKIRKEFVYDSKGLIISERLLDPKGQAQSSSTYTYDDKGRKTEWKAFDAKGILLVQTLYSYGDTDRVSVIEMKNAGGKATGSIKYESGDGGKKEKRSYLAADGALQKYEVAANENGRLKSLEVRRADGSLVQTTVYEYGSLGEVVSSALTDGAGRLRERKTFDYAFREDKKTEVYYE